MELADFKVGDIVTVIGEDLLCRDKQGKVIAVEAPSDKDGPIVVEFGKNAQMYFLPWDKDRTVCFQPNELRKDADWNIETRATDLFGPYHWHHACRLKFPFSPNNQCMHEDHQNEPEGQPKATRRILLNLWGTVYEMDACDAHTYLDGMCGEMLPNRKPKQEQEVV